MQETAASPHERDACPMPDSSVSGSDRGRWRGVRLRGTATIAIGLTALATAAGTSSAGASSTPRQWPKADPIVKIADGAVRGTTRTRYDAYLGIPYAAPPVGDLRWKAPQREAKLVGRS